MSKFLHRGYVSKHDESFNDVFFRNYSAPCKNKVNKVPIFQLPPKFLFFLLSPEKRF